MHLGFSFYGGSTPPPAGDVAAPTFVSAAVPANGLTLVLTYNEALDTGSTPATSAYTVGGIAGSVSGVNVTGSTVVLTLSQVIDNNDVPTVTYVVPGSNKVRDLAGNNAVALTGQSVTNNSTVTPPDVAAPTLSSAAIAASGLTLTLTYNEALDTGSTPATGAFSLAGTASTVSGVNVTGSTVVLTLNTAALVGETVTLNYTAGGAPIQDVAGNDAANLSSRAVTNGSTADGISVGTALLAWSDGQYNRQQDANVSATYQTSATAYTVTSASDQSRLEDTGDSNGTMLLCEGQRACVNVQSRALNSWTSDNSATSSADTHVSPDGNTNADSITFAATTISGKSKAQTGTNVTSNANLAWQCWAKSGTGGNEKFKFHLTDKSAVSPPTVDQTVDGTWRRCTWDVSSGAGAGNPTFRIWNASDAVARGAGRIVVVASMCVEVAPFPSSLILNETAAQNGIRYADLMIFPADLVPLRLREGKHSIGVRTDWASADLAGLSAYVYSFGGPNDGLRFRHNGTDVRLEAVVGGVVVASSGAVTVARMGYLLIVVDCAAGILTVNGVAGATGSTIVFPGGVPMRMGGILGGTSEAFASIDVPKAA